MSVPGIFRLDSHVFGLIADEQIHPQGIGGKTIDVVADRGEETANLAGTAGTSIPSLTMMVAI